MATAKKTTANKKTTVTKKAPVKRATVAKKKTAKETPKMRSFRVAPNTPNFNSFKITRQTVYWIVIVSFIIFMQLWILSLQLETSMYIDNQLSALQEEM